MDPTPGLEKPMYTQASDLTTVFESECFASSDPIADTYTDHSSGQRTNTDIVISGALQSTYSNLDLTVVPAGAIDILAYASAGNAKMIPLEDYDSALGLSHSWRRYSPPARRLDKSSGTITEKVLFGKFILRWTPAEEASSEEEFILYIANGRDDGSHAPDITNH